MVNQAKQKRLKNLENTKLSKTGTVEIEKLTKLKILHVRDNENLTIRRSLLNSMENNGTPVLMDDDITIIEDVQENVPEAPIHTNSTINQS